jgi:hypothetical protein
MLFCSGGVAWSQVSPYSFSSVLGTYSPITLAPIAKATSSTGVGSLDFASIQVTLPFTFNFGNGSFTQIYVNGNGSIGFGNNNSNATAVINDNTSGGGAVAAFNTDLRGIFQTTASTTTGSNVLTSVNSIGNISLGQSIEGPGIKPGVTITAIGTNTITMSDTATATSSTTVGINVLSGEIRATAVGTAPNRVFVVQWTGFQINGMNDFNIDFQIRLNEAGGVAANQTVQVYYGNSVNLSGSGTVQVGLRANNTNADFLTRTSTSSWTATAAGPSNTSTVSFSSSNMPASGLNYLFTPPPACSGTPSTAGTIISNINPVCAGDYAQLTLTGFPTGTGLGIQWSSSLDNVNFTNIPNATAGVLSVVAGAYTVYYKGLVSCSYSLGSISTSTYTLAVSQSPTTATLPYRNSFETWTTSCTNSDRPGANVLVSPNSGPVAWRRDDQGATAGWALISSGAYSPTSSVGANSARFHSFQATAAVSGNMDFYLNFSNAGTKQISFDFINTTAGDTLVLEMSTDSGKSFSRLGTFTTAATWTSNVLTTPAVATTAILRWRAISNGSTSDIGLDNVYVTTCFTPTALTATSITATSANLGYSVGGTPIGFQIQWNSGNTFVLGTGTNVFTTNNPYNLTGLTGNTQYSYFVRQVCAVGDTSEWSPRFTFTTICGLYTLPYTENFTNYLPNVCWSEAKGFLGTGSVLTGTSSNWQAGNYLNAAATNQAARLNLFSNTNREWLISSSISMGTPTATTNFALEFDAGIVNLSTTTPTGMGSDDTVAVVISTDNGATWSKSNIVKVFTAANTPINLTTGDAHYVIPLEGYSGTIKIGFYGSDGTSNDAPDYDVFIDNVKVSVCTKPTVFLGNDTVVCPGVPQTLSAGNAGSTYLWSNNATTQTINVTAGGTFSVLVTTPTGCLGRDTIVTTTGTIPSVNLGNDTGFCPGAFVTLDAKNAGNTYLWSTTATTQTINVNAAGSYYVAVTNSQKCIGRDTVVIAANSNPIVNLGNDTTVCPGSTITLNAANAGSAYLWNNSSTAQTLAVTTAGTYFVRVTNPTKCISTDTIVVYQGTNPVVNLGNDTLICPGNPLTLNAGNFGASYLYNTGATTQTTSVSTAGTYSVRVTNGSNCVGRDTIVVTLGANPVVNLGNDTVLCPGVTKTLNAGNTGASYLWSTSATTQSITVSAAATYIVVVTNAQKCVGRDTINIYNDVNPVVNLGNDTAICPGQTITLNAGNPGSAYLYSTGATTRTISVTAGGTYSVRVTNVNKCVGRDTIVIAQGVNPIVNLGNDTAACDGVAITLDAGNPGSTYQYNTGANTQTLSVTPGGTYWVVVTNAQKCVSRDTIVVSILPKASVSLINQSKIATTVNFSSDAANTTTYAWDFGDGATSNIPTPSHTYIANSNYTVRLIVTNNCGSDTAITTVNISGVNVGTVTAMPSELKLYPNPAHGIVTLENQSNLQIQSLTILNTIGSVVLQRDKIESRKELLDLSNLPSGNYMVRIHTNGGVFYHKLQIMD